MRILAPALAACLLLQTGSAFAAGAAPAIEIFESADVAEARGDRAGLEQARAAIEALLAKLPNSPMARYTRGSILSRLGVDNEAVADYDAAFRLDPTLSDAAYNAGVVLMDLGKEVEAIARFEAALGANPKHVDTLYNLGQARYNRKDFGKALDAWNRARQLAPEDFDVAKKVLQAHHALGQAAKAVQARAQLIELRKNSKDPKVRALTEFVFDQFDVPAGHVYASESFETGGDLAYVYTFRLADADDKVLGSVQLETSAVIRELGTPYVLGLSRGTLHRTLGPSWKELPEYSELKPIAIATIAREFAAGKP